MYGSAGEAAKDARTWWRFLRGDDTSFALHCQMSVQSFEYIHSCSSVARPVRAGQQLQGAPAVSDRVVPGDSASVLEAQDPLQTHLLTHDTIGDFRLLSRHLEAAIEAWKEVSKHAVGVVDSGCARKPELSNEPVLERSRGTLHPTLGLGR